MGLEEAGREELLEEVQRLRERLARFEDTGEVLRTAEQALQDTGQRLAALLGMVSDHVVLQEKDHVITWANRSTLDSLGMTSESIVGKKCHELWHGRPHECETCPISRSWASGEPEEGDMTSADGEVWRVRAYPLSGDDGEVERVLEVSRDITRRRRAEEALRESEERYRVLANATFEGIVIHEDGVIMEVNRRIQDISGYTREDLVDRNFFELLDLDYHELVRRTVERGEEGPYEIAAKAKDGSRLNLEVMGKSIPYKGRTVRVAAVRDVSEQKRAHEAIERSEGRYRLLAEHAKDIIFTLGSDLRFTYVSPSLERATGHTVDELMEMGWEDILTPDSLEAAMASISEDELGVKDPEAERGRAIMFEGELRKRDGTSMWVEVNTTLMRDEADQVAGILGVARDITERKRTQERFMEEKRRAELYLDLFGHDIRNINQGIMSYLELILLKPGLDPTEKEYMRSVLEQAVRINDLVAKVQRLTQLRTLDMVPEDMDVGRVLSGAVDYVMAKYPERTVTIKVDPECSHRPVRGSRHLLDVFTSILDNAARFDRHDEVIINVGCEATDAGTVVFWVADRGPGIPDEMKDRVFQRLDQSGMGTKGSGLGLTVVRETVKQLGGRVWVEDRVPGDPSQGSRFLLELPGAGG